MTSTRMNSALPRDDELLSGDVMTPSPRRDSSARHSRISVDVPSPEPMRRQQATAVQDCRVDDLPANTARRMIDQSEMEHRRTQVVEDAITRQLFDRLPSAQQLLLTQQQARISLILTRLYEWHQKAALAPEDRWSTKTGTKLCKFPELSGSSDYEHLIVRLRDLGYRPYVQANALYIRLPNCTDPKPVFGSQAPASDDNN